MATACFPKTARLLNAGDYKAVFDRSRYKVSNRHFLFLATATNGIRPRLGLVIAKKHVPKAVNRNKLKRALREGFRLRQDGFPQLAIVVLARKDADKLARAELTSTLDALFSDLERRAIKDSVRSQLTASTSPATA